MGYAPAVGRATAAARRRPGCIATAVPESARLSTSKIAVEGLGYVGLPLAVALARHGPVTGYDHDPERISELTGGHDRTGEITSMRSPRRRSR